MVLQYGPSPHTHRLVEQPDELAQEDGMAVYRCHCGEWQERANSWDRAVKMQANGSWPVSPKIVWFRGDKLPTTKPRERAE